MASRPIKPLRIAMLSIHSSPLGPLGTQDTGGMSVYIRELARWLGHSGHQIDIFTHSQSPFVHGELYPNVRLIHLNRNNSPALSKDQLPTHMKAIAVSLEQYSSRHHRSYDIIHSHYWISAVVGAMAQTNWHCPHITMFHTLGAAKNHTAAGENESIRRIAHERWLAKAVDGIVVPSPEERQSVMCHYHPRPNKVHTIPCGVNLNRFQPRNSLTARKELGLDTEAQIALYVGRIAPIKGINSLLGAMAQLKNSWPKLHLVIVGGDGPEAESTRTLVRRLRQHGIEKQVSLAGRIDQKALTSYYSAADFLALPSHYESFGLVILEALACGTPVVATPVGAVKTIIKNGVNGFVSDSPDQGGMTRAITRMLSAPSARFATQANIRATVTKFGWQRVAESVIKAYTLLLDAQIQSSRSDTTTGRRTDFQ